MPNTVFVKAPKSMRRARLFDTPEGMLIIKSMVSMRRSVLQNRGVCLVCERQCKINEGGKGYCGTRVNRDGVIYTMNYGNISSLSINPIEKKPLFHFYPGSRALTVGFWSCNFDCPWCQNFDITKVAPESRGFKGPPDFVDIALANSCQGTSLSFNEPTLFLEWGSEVFRLARDRKLYNTIVTNGYMTEKALHIFIEAGLDAANVDIKGDQARVQQFCHADVEKVWRNCRIMKARGVHLEITTLVIPGVNDDLKVISGIGMRILREIGNIPWHLTRYYPAYQYSEPATSLEFLDDAYHTAKQTGLKFVYLGNVGGHAYENTSCPECGALLIERRGVTLLTSKIADDGKCPQCGYDMRKDIVMR